MFFRAARSNFSEANSPTFIYSFHFNGVYFTRTGGGIYVSSLTLLCQGFKGAFVGRLHRLTLFPGFYQIGELLRCLALGAFISVREMGYFVTMYAGPVNFFRRRVFPGRRDGFVQRLGSRILYVVQMVVPGVSFLRDGFLRFQYLD